MSGQPQASNNIAMITEYGEGHDTRSRASSETVSSSTRSDSSSALVLPSTVNSKGVPSQVVTDITLVMILLNQHALILEIDGVDC